MVKRNKNKIDEWLKTPIVQKHLKHFRWSKGLNTIRLDIHYDYMDLPCIAECMGYIIMGADPYYSGDGLHTGGYDDETVKRVKKILELPEEEKHVISELFEYLETECPRKKMKQLIEEYKINYSELLGGT